MYDQRDHISICICTYKRLTFLKRLLEKVQYQITNDLFTYSIIVVDNDYSQSAKVVVISVKERSKIDIVYFNEPEKNISMARNKAIQNVSGNYVAFIDDDEFPDDAWLHNLYKTRSNFDADGVLGPVKPHFETEPPQWIIKGALLERESFQTGTLIKNFRYTRTGNVLLAAKIFAAQPVPFDPALGRSGGEDSDFFKRMLDRGYTFVWCDEACVYETVPPERFTRAYFLKRALLRGVVAARYASFISMGTLKSFVALILYTLALPLFLCIGSHLFMRFLIKACDHIGKLLALCGLKVIQERAC
jgi:glycosyltransferase involved in cell wall biosynthesis